MPYADKERGNLAHKDWYYRTHETRKAQAHDRYYRNHEQSKADARKESKSAYWRNPELFRKRSIKSRFKRMYGITLEQRDALMATNDGMCVICGERPSEVIDHCHRTNQVRAALCGHCNRGLGCFLDDPNLIEKALKYLRSYL